MKILKGKTIQPRRVLAHGTHGVGKSTWASKAKNPIFLQFEEGLADIGVDRTPLITDIGAFSECCSWLLTSDEHNYGSVVIDTADWLERLIHQSIAAKKEKSDIEEIGYGKGYKLAMKGWEWVTHNLDQLRNRRGMNIIILAHTRIVKFEPPDGDSYNRYVPDLHDMASAFLQEWCDEVFYLCYQVQTITQDEGFNRTRNRAIGSGQRTVWTEEMPTHLAKRRIQMPSQIPLDWAEYVKYWPQPAGDVAGIVQDGTSKHRSDMPVAQA